MTAIASSQLAGEIILKKSDLIAFHIHLNVFYCDDG